MNPQLLRDTEAKIQKLWEDGEIPYLTHLMGGNEEWLCDFFAKNIRPMDWVFASHRCHFHFLLHQWMSFHHDARWPIMEDSFKVTAEILLDKVLKGKSMFLYGPRFVCSAIVAGTPAMAAGVALDIQREGGSEKVWCFVGDGAEDEGHFYEAVRYAVGRNLPCHFIIEDNNGSCGVTKEQRGSPEWEWPSSHVTRHRYQMTHPHAGTNVRPKLK